jgi:hypothetical protein
MPIDVLWGRSHGFQAQDVIAPAEGKLGCGYAVRLPKLIQIFTARRISSAASDSQSVVRSATARLMRVVTTSERSALYSPSYYGQHAAIERLGVF